MAQHSIINAFKSIKAKQRKWNQSLRKKFARLKTKHKSQLYERDTIELRHYPTIRLDRFRFDDSEDLAQSLGGSRSTSFDGPCEPPSCQTPCSASQVSPASSRTYVASGAPSFVGYSCQTPYSASQVSQASSRTYVASRAPSFVGYGDYGHSLDSPVLGPNFDDENYPWWLLASKPKHSTPPPFQNGSLDIYVAHINTPGNIYSVLQDYNSNASDCEPTPPIFVDNSIVPEPEIHFGSPDSNTNLASSISSESWTTTPTSTSVPDKYNLNYPLRKDIFFPAESPIFNMLLRAEQSLKYLKRALSLAQQSFFDFCKIHFPGLVEYKSQSLWDFQNSIGFPDGPSLIQWTKEKMGDYLNNLDGEKMNTTKPFGAIKRLLDYPYLVSPKIWPSELQDALVQATDVRNAVCHPTAQTLCNPENVDALLRKAQKAVALMDPDSVRAMEVFGMRMSMKQDLEREWELMKGVFGHMKENGGKEPPGLEVHQRRCLDMMRRDLFERAKRNYEGFSKWAASALETNHIDKLYFIGV